MGVAMLGISVLGATASVVVALHQHIVRSTKPGTYTHIQRRSSHLGAEDNEGSIALVGRRPCPTGLAEGLCSCGIDEPGVEVGIREGSAVAVGIGGGVGLHASTVNQSHSPICLASR